MRDNLGKHSWKLYLVGWHELTPHRRQMLESRNVIPVDLARHPKARDWPKHQRYRLANEWALRTLEHGRPYDSSDWPDPPPDPPSIDPVLQPVCTISSPIPSSEPSRPRPAPEEQTIPRDEVARVVGIWAHNRSLYPGWLAVPFSRRHSLLSNTDRWESPMLRSLSDYTFKERLRVVHEIVWRRTILLTPPSDELREACTSLLDGADLSHAFRRGIHDADPRPPLHGSGCDRLRISFSPPRACGSIAPSLIVSCRCLRHFISKTRTYVKSGTMSKHSGMPIP